MRTSFVEGILNHLAVLLRVPSQTADRDSSKELEEHRFIAFAGLTPLLPSTVVEKFICHVRSILFSSLMTF